MEAPEDVAPWDFIEVIARLGGCWLSRCATTVESRILTAMSPPRGARTSRSAVPPWGSTRTPVAPVPPAPEAARPGQERLVLVALCHRDRRRGGRPDRRGRCRWITNKCEKRHALWLAAAGADLVVDETLLEADPIADVARRAGVTVWIAGPPLVAALRHAAGITRRGARPSAAMLARLPGVPWLRSLLRRLEPPDDERQIALL